MGKTVTAQEFFSEPTETSTPEGPKTVSPEEFFGTETPTSAIPSIPDEHASSFVSKLGDAFHRAMGGLLEGNATANEVIGSFLKISPLGYGLMGEKVMDAYDKTFVEPGKAAGKQARAETPGEGTAEKILFGFAEAMGSMPPVILSDVMTGSVTKMALANRVLPAAEAMLSKIPNFVLGSGWRGFMDSVDNTEGGVIEKTVAGATGAGESMATNFAFAKAGTGLAGIGKMMSIGIAESFYNAAKQGRMPTQDEMIESTTQAGMMGVVFSALPHLVEGAQEPVEKKALGRYAKKAETVAPTELQKTVTDLLADDKIRPEIRETVAKILTSWKDSRGEVAPSDFLLGNWKDQPQLLLNINTMERNFEKVAPKDAPELKATITDKIKENETAHNRWRSSLISGIEEEMIARGVKPNTSDATFAVWYGEKRMTLTELKAATPNWENVVKAAEFSRWVYDTTLDGINETSIKNGVDPIKKRADYFRHFQEISDATNDLGFFFSKDAIKNWIASKKERTARAGLAVDPKSGKPFTSTEMRREGKQTKEDAVLMLQNYIKSAGPRLFHTDSVARVRTLENYIREQAHINELAMKAGQPYVEVDLSNFANTLNMYGDLLAGQRTDLSRTVERWVGRPFVAMVRGMNRSMTANMIGYNVSSSLMNVLPFAQNAEFAVNHPIATMRGILYAASHMEHDAPFEFKVKLKNGEQVTVRSALNDRRYPKAFLPENWRENVVSKGFVLPNLIDRFTTRSIIAGKLFDAQREGLETKADAEAAMGRSDDYASRMVQDRSKGQLPNIMAEPDMQLISKFQVEQANLFAWLLHDLPKEAHGDFAKAFGSAAIYSIASLVMNQVFEKGIPQLLVPGMGRRPLPDPIYLLGTLLGWTKAGDNRPFVERIKPAFKQFAGAVPFGNLVLEGGRFPLSAAMPDVTKMFDSEAEFINQMKKPLTYLVNPLGGGGQIKKAVEGTMAAHRGYTKTTAGNLQYEVQSVFMNYVRGFLFGKNAFPEAVAHWNKPKGGSD